MSSLFCSSIGRKLVMSLSGVFLMMFLLVHLGCNFTLLIPDGGEWFNAVCHFMATNLMIRIVEPILALGFLIHIAMGVMLSIQNRKARGNDRYASGNATEGVSFFSKNMLLLGIALFAFLVLHISQFYAKMKGLIPEELLTSTTIDIAGVPTEVENAYALVHFTFQNWINVAATVIGSLALAAHLSHGFWSAFQTVGFSNKVWRCRLTVIGQVFAWFVGIAFSAIAILQNLLF